MRVFFFPIFLSILLSKKVSGVDSNEEGKPFVLKHKWTDTPAGWQLHGSPPPDHRLKLHIGLKQNGFDNLIEQLLEVSDPDHKRYGDHLSKDALNKFVAPSQETTDAVNDWLMSNGIDPSDIQRSDAGDWLYVNASVRTVESMLQTKYQTFRHEGTEELIIRSLSWSLPASLEEHVELVAPTTSFSSSRAMQVSSGDQIPLGPPNGFSQTELRPPRHACNRTSITPNCLRTLYGTIDYVPSASSKNAVGVTGYLNQYPSYSDLETFMKDFRPDAKDATFKLVQINGGGNNQSEPGGEANLDIQYVEGIGYPTPVTFYSVGGLAPTNPDENTPPGTNEPYLDWLQYINKQHDIPQVITTSYGDTEQTVPRDYATRVCKEFAKLGAGGISIIFSSGDDGVGTGNCTTNDGTERTLFQPNFPASCPWVTSVGATANFTPEVGVSFSSGGFSRYFKQPEYQKSAVEHYLDIIGDEYKGLFNRKGRGYPDVSAQGEAFNIINGGERIRLDGTSASGPTFAAIIALVNDYRLSHHKPVLGFLNPLLYKYPALLTDITSGNNPGCETDGFEATRGWDPVTGLGTPDFRKLQAVP